MPIFSIVSPAAAKRTGKRPQASPSLRLLTIPAWLTEDSDLSRKLVRVKISRLLKCPWASAWAYVWLAASSRAWPWVSFTAKTDSPRPSAM